VTFLSLFIDILFGALWVAILGRVIISWVNLSPYNPIVVAIYQITEPILAPIRRVLPQMGMIDLSPMVAIIVMWIVREVLSRLIQA